MRKKPKPSLVAAMAKARAERHAMRATRPSRPSPLSAVARRLNFARARKVRLENMRVQLDVEIMQLEQEHARIAARLAYNPED